MSYYVTPNGQYYKHEGSGRKVRVSSQEYRDATKMPGTVKGGYTNQFGGVRTYSATGKFQVYQEGDHVVVIDIETNRRHIIKKPLQYVCILEPDREGHFYLYHNDGQPVRDPFLIKFTEEIVGTKMFDNVSYMLHSTLRDKGIVPYYKSDSPGCYYFNRDQVSWEIARLNMRLQDSCPSLRLMFDHRFVLPGDVNTYANRVDMLTLCLYFGERCIASVMIDNDKDIFSFTVEEYRGTGYNKMLRAVLIMICSVLVCAGSLSFDTVYSVAENPVSAYVLLKDFNAEIVNPDEYRYYTAQNQEKSLKDQIFGFYKQETGSDDGQIYLKLAINIRDNLEIAHQIFTKALANISCPSF